MKLLTGVVRSMPHHNWLGEVAANVSNRVGKWEDWEKSPALKSSEERLRNYKPEESVSSSGPAQPEKKTGILYLAPANAEKTSSKIHKGGQQYD